MQYFKIAAPMMQAMVLMLVYSFLPIYMILGKFEIDAMLKAAALIFSVKLFTAIFEIAHYLDQALFLAMFPDMSHLGSLVTLGPKRLVYEMVVMSLYIVGPLVLLNLVSMAGSEIRSVGDAGANANKTGSLAAGQATGSAISGGAREAKRAVRQS